MASPAPAKDRSDAEQKPAAPSISLPKGGGAVRGMGEKFTANPVTGTGALSVPLAISSGRSGFGPELSLNYDSAAGNGPFGFGWHLSIPSITRKTDKGLPQYRDVEESDVYLLSGSEDLVPVLQADGARFEDRATAPGWIIHCYRPRIEGLFARIERWTRITTGNIHWRSITRDNVTTRYGTDDRSRIVGPGEAQAVASARVFSWLICESYDDKGNAIVYEYVAENDVNVDQTQVHERNRLRTANRYLKRIKYGNRVSRLLQPDLDQASFMFEVVFDYDEDHYEDVDLHADLPTDEKHRFARASAAAGRAWAVRPDPFSSHRAGYEVRAYRRCHRVLMFHHIPELPTGEKGYDGLVRATEFDYADLDYSQPVTIEVELAHQGSTRFASFIRVVTQSGYVRDEAEPTVVRNGVEYATYLKKSLPPLEFEYSKAVIQDEVRELEPGSGENLPEGLDGSDYQWVDLDGEGLSGVLTEQAGAWFYKPNLGHGRLGPLRLVAPKPSIADLRSGRQQLLDLAGDGQLDLVDFDSPAAGYYERTSDEDWAPFRAFRALPSIRWDDPNLRFLDVNGDGFADILISEDHVFAWYRSLAKTGFEPAQRVAQPIDEESGPRLVFADAGQSIYLADMCGDGLTDIVRIRNGEVCYWPNLGYGRFGAKVSFDNAPFFDRPDAFDQRRIRLADIDGSGGSDIVYLGRDGARLYFNQSSNRLSEARRLDTFPGVDSVASVTVADLLGNGTACLVWSSPLPAEARRPLRYIDLFGGNKPHLLIKSANNLGAETHVHYAPSTRFYLEDKARGKPWITRLPFPVHVVERVVTCDRVSGNRFTTRYAYHHGYFDGVEREFRGFGLVEQWDTEEFAALDATGQEPAGTNLDPSSHVPPILTKSWFHTGLYLGRAHVSDFFAGLLDVNDAGEYYRETGLNDQEARSRLLDDTVLPFDLTVEEEREACRALKGALLRQEVYALDGTDKESFPYAVTEQNFAIGVLQRRRDIRHGVFFTHARESISHHYERNPADPRIAHMLTIEVDDFGNVLQSATIGYGRRRADATLPQADQDEQTQIHITHAHNRVTNAIDAPHAYRAPQPSESLLYELTGLGAPTNGPRFSFEEVRAAIIGAAPLDYEKNPTAGLVEKRLIEHVRSYCRRDDLSGPLPLGKVEPRALPFETYKLALTPGLVAGAYGGRVDETMLADKARYAHTEGDSNWWIPSGTLFYAPDPAALPAEELAYAEAHFFLPHRFRDPFHTEATRTESFVAYDQYDLLPEETRDALGNRVTVGERHVDPAQPLVRRAQDYRVLQPRLVMDSNRNRTSVAYDALGLVAGSAVMGKPEDNPAPGDRLTSAFRADLTQAEIDAFFANPRGPVAATLIGEATIRTIYDLTSFGREIDPLRKRPAFAATISRESHVGDSPPHGASKLQVGFSYSDGFGREIQRKVQAEAGPAPVRDADGRIIIGADGRPQMTASAIDPRWVGSGWSVFNNKGKPIRQYEPFFTDTHAFEFDVRVGVSPVLFYDPVERVVATLHPNHTWEKVVFGPWRQESWDVNDTVLIADPKTDADIGDFFRRLPDADYLPTWRTQRQGGALGPQEQAAAGKAAIHAATPSVAHFDSLGRSFLTVSHNRFKFSDTSAADPPTEEFHQTRVIFDIEGNQRQVIDAKDRVVAHYDYDLLGTRIHQASMEAGERRMLGDVAGKPIYAWDSRDHQFRTEYDLLRRPLRAFVTGADSANPNQELLTERLVYGEQHPEDQLRNLRGNLYLHLDQAGVVTSEAHDFKGNLLHATRRLAREYKGAVDWSAIDTVLPANSTAKLDPATLEAALAPLVESETYTSRTRYDALNRPVQLIAPRSDQPDAKRNIIQPVYNEANLLEQLHVWLDHPTETTALLDSTVVPPSPVGVDNIDYDAKGQRKLIDYSNGVSTSYEYDPLTFRLMHLLTQRNAVAFPGDCPQPPPAGCQVQNLSYCYDPVGNISAIRDDAQQTIYFNNTCVEPSADYTYDALYRLIEATGREHLGQAGGTPIPHSHNDAPRVGIDWSANDGAAMGRYLEQYVYDAVGNFQEMIHRGSDPVNLGWKRGYAYNEPSLIEPAKQSNRLSSTTVGSTNPITETYAYDAHGNMLRMPHLAHMEWDFKDELRVVDLGGGGTAYYVYDSGGQRMRKVIEKNAGTLIEERIYLGGFEVFRKRQNGVVALVRETLHVMDDKKRIALVETRTQGDEPGVPAQLIRYQFGNHLGSASLELDHEAQIVSYEEYTPYGSTSYQAVRSQTEAPKRYRYTGMERDDESGLSYHTARYYAPWLGRWTKPDPAGLVDGPNVYEYVRGSPLKLTDSTGTNPDDDDNVTFSSGGPFRRVPMKPHIDEADAVKGNLAGGIAGSPSDPENKSFLDPRTNTQSKSNFVSNAPRNPRPNVSIANSPLEAAYRLITGRFSEVDEVRALADDATARTRPGLCTNSVLRVGIKTDPRTRGALSSIGFNPDTLALETPVGAPQFPTTESVNLSAVDADINPNTGEVVAGPNTSAALARRAATATNPGQVVTGSTTSVALVRGVGIGNAAADVGRAVVPGVVEAEAALLSGAMYAFGTGHPVLGGALLRGAAAVPVVGGGLVAGAVFGNAFEEGARRLGLSEDAAEGVGLVGSVAAGAGVGALIGLPFGGIGAGPGAVVGGAAGLVGYAGERVFAPIDWAWLR